MRVLTVLKFITKIDRHCSIDDTAEGGLTTFRKLFTVIPCASKHLRGVLFIVRAGGDIIKAEFMHTKRTNCLTKMKIGIHLEDLK